MFFVGVFGIESKEKEIKDIQNIFCKTCGSLSSYKLIKTYNFFDFFFIPLFKWNEKYYLISRCCKNVFTIPRELGRYIEQGKDVSVRDEDLTPLNNNYGNNACPSCYTQVDSSFLYCPYCGSKIR